MGGQTVPNLDPATLEGLQGRAGAEGTADPLAAPFAEGARARDIADFCDSADIPALLIDRAGRVLHASQSASRFLGGQVTLSSDQVVGASDEANRTLQEILSNALFSEGTQVRRRSTTIAGSRGDEAMTVSVVDFPSDSPYQMLKAVLILDEDESGTRYAPRLADRLQAG